MKYFTKWLPVEGEIKEGDHFYNPTTKEVLLASHDMLSWNSDDSQEHKGWKKVKLFLCLKDVNIGDRKAYHIKYPDKGGHWVNSSELEDMVEWEGENVDSDDLFNVVGEISSDATWVKEGDTFKDEQILFQCSEHPPFEGWYDVSKQQFLTTKSPYKIIKIKCPTCKTNH